MRPLRLDEIVDPERYEALRPSYRKAVIAHKRHRRLALGEMVTLVFEDRETLRFQVQEMIRVERIRDPALVQQELDVYNELMPGERELSATLFVEITELAAIRPELDRLIGIDEHVALVLGDDERDVIRARFDPKQMEQERISAVQYIRFSLDAAQAERFADPAVPARLRCDHPHYRHEAELPPDVRRSLVSDLGGEPESLLASEPAAAAADADDESLLFTRGRVRVRRPPDPIAPGHVIVEAAPRVSLLDADAALRAEVLEVVIELARAIAERHGGCRIHADAGASRLGWHLHAPPR